MSDSTVIGVFDGLYAATYDLVYQSKDYGSEIEAVSRLLNAHYTGKIETLLDLGCGTGRHSSLLVQHGYDVTGLDQSAVMLGQARERAMSQKLNRSLRFEQADLRNFDLGRKYDAALMMFNVLGYIFENDGLLAMLRSVRRHLDAGHLFVFDFWYGPAVVADPPRDREKEFVVEGAILRRNTMTNFRPHDQRCDIDIRVSRVENGEVAAEATEHHQVRYFFPLELELALRACGFRLAALSRFPQIDEAPVIEDWTAACVAVAVDVPAAAAGTSAKGDA